MSERKQIEALRVQCVEKFAECHTLEVATNASRSILIMIAKKQLDAVIDVVRRDVSNNTLRVLHDRYLQETGDENKAIGNVIEHYIEVLGDVLAAKIENLGHDVAKLKGKGEALKDVSTELNNILNSSIPEMVNSSRPDFGG